MKRIRFMDLSFRDGFQSVLGARVKTDDFLPALEAAVTAGSTYFEIGGGARFQSLYFYCREDAFEMMDRCRRTVGPDVELQTLARGINVVGLSSQPRDIINLHAKLFKKHGVSAIRNFDALNDVRNLDYSGGCIHDNGLRHEISITLMGLPPGVKDTYPHSPDFYLDRVRSILEAEIPFDSLCFKDASGTTPPAIVHETVKRARKLLPAEIPIHFHTHCTAGLAVSCHMAAIEAGADIIDLAMRPVSGGTGAPDILTMWHRLKGTQYTLDIDYEKYLEAEDVFIKCLERYFFPPEARETTPLITLSPMPGGALTANTQMMRDSNCLHLYPQVIHAMREVVERGGFGTSVTPVSQFYFQQAFANVTQGPWKTMTEGYGKMVLGYFGRTPAPPDPEIVRLAADKLGLAPSDASPVDLNDADPKLGVEAARKTLQAAGLPDTEENIFITATCGEKGVAFLNGDRPLGIRYKDTEAAPGPAPGTSVAPRDADKPVEIYDVTVDGRTFRVRVAPDGGGRSDEIRIESAAPAPGPVRAADETITAPMPGSVLRVIAPEGTRVGDGDTILVLEAMKMEVEVKSAVPGTVKVLHVREGDTVASGQPLADVG
ncbi:MAG: biotin attachment protein [Kiritimatiellaeota bacterium]|nr:biotin attachment protein [Kiritimatiellota bacterium]